MSIIFRIELTFRFPLCCQELENAGMTVGSANPPFSYFLLQKIKDGIPLRLASLCTAKL
ncbi:hypothetical protein [Hoeflea sp.]|uniref:hypothetical protein n=1 Tax=Hoeflea sp. TaxID=1940281 RepID=UPI003B52808D